MSEILTRRGPIRLRDYKLLNVTHVEFDSRLPSLRTYEEKTENECQKYQTNVINIKKPKPKQAAKLSDTCDIRTYDFKTFAKGKRSVDDIMQDEIPVMQ